MPPRNPASLTAGDASAKLKRPRPESDRAPKTPPRPDLRGAKPDPGGTSSRTEIGLIPHTKRRKTKHINSDTSTAPAPAAANPASASQNIYPRRNLAEIKPKARSSRTETDIPSSTPVSSTPVRGSGSHPVPSNPQTKRRVDAAIQLELEGKRNEAGDLVDHLVGSFISPDDAACILQAFLDDKYASILQGPRGHKTVVDQAVRFASARGCIRSSAPTPHTKAWLKAGSMKLPLPVSPVDEGELVAFLNGAITRAFKALKKAGKSVADREQISQFSAVRRQHHALPLSHPDDEADMRPDFGLLPLSAWSPAGDMLPPAFPPVDAPPKKKPRLDVHKNVPEVTPSSSTTLLPAFESTAGSTLPRLDRFPRSFAAEPYLNFSAFLCVGESKTSDSAAGKRQLKRYVRGLKRAQPWLRFALGLSYAKGVLHVLRADQSGTEECSLDLSHPGHVLDFARLLVGMAVMTEEELGADPAFELHQRDAPLLNQADGESRRSSRSSSRVSSKPAKIPAKPRSQLGKRKAPDVDPSPDAQIYKIRYIKTLAAHTIDGSIARYDILGVLHVSGSMRGRGTFAMAGKDGSGKLVAIKRMWGDCARPLREHELLADVEVGIKRIGAKKAVGTAFILRALKSWVVDHHGDEDSTLCSIRGFQQSELAHPCVENRLQQCLVTDLKRPLALFWNLQDVVGGLIDAIKGHQFLVDQLGILHRDISETNIVLRVSRTEKARGYLMDLDMATKLPALGDTSLPTSQSDSTTAVGSSRGSGTDSADGSSAYRPPKAARTGTTPYMSISCLRGHEHTISHDLESFFYVLYLFLHTYDGPLPPSPEWPRAELFVAGRSRRLPHVRNWPLNLQAWTSGNLDAIANDKTGRMADADYMWDSLRAELPVHWRGREDVHELVRATYGVFWRGVDGTKVHILRVDVVHAELVHALEEWLRRFPEATADGSGGKA